MLTYAVFWPGLLGLGVLALFIAKRLRRVHADALASMEDPVILEIKVPRVDDTVSHSPQTTSLLAENMFASLHGLLRTDARAQEHFSFEIVSHGLGGIRFYVVVPERVSRFVESQVYAQYPQALIRQVDDYKSAIGENAYVELAELSLTKESFFPLKSFRDLEVDPLSSITSVMSQADPEDLFGLQVVARPMPDTWQADGYKYTSAIRDGLPATKFSAGEEVHNIFSSLMAELGALMIGVVTNLFRNPEEPQSKSVVKPLSTRLSPTQDAELRAVENKLSKLGYSVQIRVIVATKDAYTADSDIRSLMATFKQFYTATTNGFVIARRFVNNPKAIQRFFKRALDPSRAFILNTEELAAVFHLPSSVIATPNMSSWIYSKKAEPPSGLPTTDCTYIGETIYRDKKIRFGIKNNADRLRHMYIIGKSGVGKSTLIETMASQDIANGFGVGVLDPHGDTIEHLLERIPEERLDDVVIVDPSDVNHPVAINLMELPDPSQKNLMASAVVSAIKHHFDYSWGPRLEYLLNYAVLTLLEAPNTTMLGITRLLEDPNYLNYVLQYVKDPVVLKFWNTEYKAMKGNVKLVTEAIAPIQNKVNRFLASSTVRNILGQQKSTIDIWDVMNSGKILLMNLSIGKIGEDNANLLGALLVSHIQFMALQRAKIPPEERRPFYLYVDEFQNFATGSFESILSESRKYKLGLYLTHQYTAQLPDDLLKAVLGNVGTIASFSLGAPDAAVMANEFAPFFDRQDLISMERFHIYLKLMIDGMTSMPFSARILVPWEPGGEVVPKSGNRDRAVQRSREQYGVPLDQVEREINTWTETHFDKGMAINEIRKTNPNFSGVRTAPAGNNTKNSGKPRPKKGRANDPAVVSLFRVGETYDGVIDDVANFGVFVLLKPGARGLIHASELPKGESPKDFEGKIGETIRVKVIRIESDTNRIGLSLHTVS